MSERSVPSTIAADRPTDRPTVGPTAPSVDLPTPRPRLRPARPTDHLAIRALFRTTILAGDPLPGSVLGARDCLARYERLCLDAYLSDGLVIVVEDDDAIVGYLLGCLDEQAHRRHQTRQALGWVVHAGLGVATGRIRGDARRFVRLRIHDGWVAWRRGPRPPFPAHAHINLARSARARRVGFDLVAAMDAAVAAAGLPGWYGEVTVPAGRSLAAAARAGASVVHRQPNRTFT
ncbi:MAG: hypothetical protein JJT89_03295 [Nitriliruptoraceae bacterium]|nr:hypothetical protein [Nitriliruptoraceae bacterium]